MPAPLAKGIIITLTLLTTLGAALMANPQVRAWVEEQRRKIAEALRSLGDELDPQSRRQAEAFAFEGRIPGQRPEAARRESEAARDAVAKATGRDGVDLDETSRRLSKIGRTKLGEEDEAERRRLGREYLARRNQEMMEAKEKARMKKSAASLSASENLESTSTDKNASRAFAENLSMTKQPAPPLGSFDRLVDLDGSLKADFTAGEDMDTTLELPSPPTDEPKSFGKRKIAIAEIVEPEQEESRSTPISAFEAGSRWANPFGDEFEVEASGYATPKPRAPAVPPKISLAEDPETSVPELQPEGESEQLEPAPIERLHEEEAMSESWTEDEQIARALSLSMADEERRREKRLAKQDSEDPDLAAAIAASLAEGSVHIQEHVQQKVDTAMQRSHSIMEAAMQKSQNNVEAAMQKKNRKLAAAQATVMEKTRNLPQPEMTQRVEQFIDISSDPPISVPHQHSSPPSPRTPNMGSPRRTSSDDSDSMYGLSPEYRARRATRFGSDQPETRHDDTGSAHNLHAQSKAGQDAPYPSPFFWPPITPQTTAQLNQQYDPVHEAASLNTSRSFEPYVSSHATASSTTAENGQDSYASLPSLIDVSDEPQREHQSLFHASNQHSIRNHIDSVYTHQLHQLGSGMPSSQQQTQHDEISSKLALHAATLSLDQNNRYHSTYQSTYQSKPQSPPQHSQYFARYQSQIQDENASPSAHVDGNPRPRSLDLNGKHVSSGEGGDGARTPTTATLSPEFERESIGFLTDSEDEFASAKGSVALLSGASGLATTSARRTSTASFTTDPAACNDLEDNGSLVGHSDAETSSLVDVEESPKGKQHVGEAGNEQHMEGVYSGEDSDDDWSSGVKTPGSEWTDVGSQVSEEEVGGQDSSRLIRL